MDFTARRRASQKAKSSLREMDGGNKSSGFIQQNSSEIAFNTSDSWVVLSPIEQSIKRKIESVGTPLKDWDIQIYRGILTGYNDAFIITTEKHNEILSNCKTADEKKRTEELIRPILRGNTIQAYKIQWNGDYIINFHNGYVDKNGKKIDAPEPKDFPAIIKHIDSINDEVEKGLRKTKGGHKGSNKGFYERTDCGDTPYNLRPCKYIDYFNYPKIVWKQTSSVQTFVLDENGFFLDVSGQFLCSKNNSKNELLWILAFLNSKLSKYWFLSNAVKFGSQGIRWIPAFVNELPIPKSYKYKSEIVQLVKSELKNPSPETERKIDSLVYHLYNLTDDEIAFIEGN